MKNISIGVKMMVLTGMLFLFCTLLSAVIYWNIIEDASREELQRVSEQTLSSINDGINSQLDYIHNYAITLMLGAPFQKLVSGSPKEQGLETQIEMERTLYQITEFSEHIDTIYFLDAGQKLYGVKSTGEAAGNSFLEKAAAVFLQEAEYAGSWDILPRALSPNGEADISLVFDLQSVADFSNLGVVVIEIDMDRLVAAFGDTLRKYDLDLQIQDASGRVIKAFERQTSDDIREFCIAKLEMDNGGDVWEYTSAAQNGMMDEAFVKSRRITLLLLAINSCVLFFGIYGIIRGFLKPLKRLVRAIDRTGEEDLAKVDLKSDTREMLQLQDAYNRMTDRIEKLLARIVEEQKNIRKMELSLLQAQINPHFLYNTLNDISALIVTDRKTEAYQVMKAFGSFYRRTLSKGRDSIPLKEELMIVHDYLVVCRMRFESVFDVEESIDESCLTVPVPKLMLQPLVENAIYHGLRPLGRRGILRICVRQEKEGGVCISIADDGVGMSEAYMQEVLEGRSKEGMQSFGLQKTIERIGLYFGKTDCVEIHSSPGRGTELVIQVPGGTD